MLPLKVLSILLLLVVNITYSMYYLTNFHADYPHAHVIIASCGDTVSLSCPIVSENDSVSSIPTMWFRLYENAYPQPLILGDRQLIDDQRFMLRTQNHDRHLEIVGARKDDQGYYLCKAGNEIQSSYNLTILTSSCIDIVPDKLHIGTDEPIHLLCRIRAIDTANQAMLPVQWTHDDHPLGNLTESFANSSFVDGVAYETLVIPKASRTDAGTYACRYGEQLTASAHIIVNHFPGGSKSRRLISQLRGNNSSSTASTRTVITCFYIVYQMIFVTSVSLS